MYSLLIKNGGDVNSVGYHEYTPLHIAAKAGDESIVAFLLENKADPNSIGHKNKTPLHKAGTPEIAEILLQHKADPCANEAGRSVFDVFRHCHSRAFCEVLFNASIGTNGQHPNSRTFELVYDLNLFRHEAKLSGQKHHEMITHVKTLCSKKELLEHPALQTMSFLKRKRVIPRLLIEVIRYQAFLV